MPEDNDERNAPEDVGAPADAKDAKGLSFEEWAAEFEKMDRSALMVADAPAVVVRVLRCRNPECRVETPFLDYGNRVSYKELTAPAGSNIPAELVASLFQDNQLDKAKNYLADRRVVSCSNCGSIYRLTPLQGE